MYSLRYIMTVISKCDFSIRLKCKIVKVCFKGINIDFETDDLEATPREVTNRYSDILAMAEQGFIKAISMETIKEHYEVPKITVDGKE